MARSRVEGTVQQSSDKVAATVRQYATGQNWRSDDLEADSRVLTFTAKKNAASFAQTITVTLSRVEEGATAVVVETAVFQLYDWGRGKKLAQGLLDSLTTQRS